VSMKRDIKSMLLPELTEYFKSTNQQTYRAQQVFSWVHKGISSFSEMTNIPIALREKLEDEFFISVPVLVEKQISGIDGTVKYLWQVLDGDMVECVLMKYSHGNSICISTQIGCKMGCTFCASAIDGYKRNLHASEMIDQVLFTQKDYGERISNVVLMGIGEPLDNFDNVLRFYRLVTHADGACIGARHLTVSTCGIIENIDRLADYDVQFTLAVSLHAPDDDTRSVLMPISRNNAVKDLLAAGERYFKRTGRRVTYEYAMIDGVNDSPRQAELLSELMVNTSGHLNLIYLSNVHECVFKSSSKENFDIFTTALRKNGVSYTIRRSLGCDIDASCGQLRRRKLQHDNH